ncbi:MAG: hypothetical protein M1833_005851 [Piccolia ochrophora]|nr:MAG: hypothetical protein M1833_005851 [Piccolia ochrophora]
MTIKDEASSPHRAATDIDMTSPPAPRPSISDETDRSTIIPDLSSPEPSISTTTSLSGNSPLLERQQDLFSLLAAICTSAAGTYWASVKCSTTPSGAPPVDDSTTSTLESSVRKRYYQYRLRTSIVASHATLFDHLHALSSQMWAARPRPPSPQSAAATAAQTRAVHRMGNLYSWGGKVIQAVEMVESGVSIVEDGVVWGVVMAARDLCAWCLSEEGKKAVEDAWARYCRGEEVGMGGFA